MAGRIHFDKKAKPADFISYNAVLALAEAGRRPETDAHLDLAVKAMLAAQRPEGSWEGDPVYQGFNTPFRATQFAVMALSTLYPGDHQRKELGCGVPRAGDGSCEDDLPLLLQQLDQFWDLALRSAVAPDSRDPSSTAISRSHVKPPPAHWVTWPIRELCTA